MDSAPVEDPGPKAKDRELKVALDDLQESLSFLKQSQADVANQFQWLSDRVENTEKWAKKTTKTLDFILDRVRHMHPHPAQNDCKCGNFTGEIGMECPLCGEKIK